jgi:hypothetical protein
VPFHLRWEGTRGDCTRGTDAGIEGGIVRSGAGTCAFPCFHCIGLLDSSAHIVGDSPPPDSNPVSASTYSDTVPSSSPSKVSLYPLVSMV